MFYTWCDLVTLQYVQNKKGKQAMSREEMMKLIYTHARIMKPYILQLQFVVKKIDDDLLLLSHMKYLHINILYI